MKRLLALVVVLFTLLSGHAFAQCGGGVNGTPQTATYLLQNEFQDGQSVGAITPACVRDFLASAPGMATVATISAGTGCPSVGTTLTASYTIVSTATSMSSCVTLPAQVNTTFQISNRSANGVNVYPPSTSARIETFAAGTAPTGSSTNPPLTSVTIPANSIGIFTCSSTTQCQWTNNNIGPRIVIANYTLDHSNHYSNSPPTAPSVTDYQNEILTAQAMGIDAFELDMQFTRTAQTSGFDYDTAVANFFTAAGNLGTGFKLYFMIDCQNNNVALSPTCGAGTQTIMATYASNANYLTYNGRPVLGGFSTGYSSTSGGTDETFWHGIYTNAVTGCSCTPFYIPATSEELVVGLDNTVSQQTTADAAWYNCSNGATCNLLNDTDGISEWYFDNPNVNNVKQDAMSATMAQYQKVMMGNAMGWFGQLRFLTSTNPGAARYFEQHGAENMVTNWQHLINTLKPPMVRIQTWNDHTESDIGNVNLTTMQTADTNFGGVTGRWQVPTTMLYDHTPFAILNSYFTQYYKTGNPPANYPDSMFVFYRNAAQSVSPSPTITGTSVNWRPNGTGSSNSEPTLDDIYVTTILQKNATLTVTTNATVTSVFAGAGVNSFRFPFSAGATQTMVLARNGSNIISITGAAVVSSETAWLNVSPLAYYGHNP